MAQEFSTLSDRYEHTLSRIAAAAKSAGRDPSEITLVGVSKKFPPEVIREAYHAGLRHVGENRVQELVPKWEELRDLDITWHMVGPLQTNKINKVLGRIHMLESLDRIELAQALHKRLPGPLDCLVEVNTSREETKHGLTPNELPHFLDEVASLDKLRILGLMTVGPLTDDPDEIREAFRTLAQLFSSEGSRRRPGQEFQWLSMGMTGDFDIAIEEGSNMVRIGTGIFGPRP